MSALNLAKSWRSDEEPRLGYFKIAGLTDVRVSDEPFVPLPESLQTLPHPDDQFIIGVQSAAEAEG